ncbi:MAG: methyltransferase domain-containing protein, partial [candidate division KSB1 bacterium]
AIIGEHVRGAKALDFGCGAGRSTRFLRELGFEVVGVDISEHMLAQARERDREGKYFLLPEGNLDGFAAEYDLVLSAFTFDNVPTLEKKIALMRSLQRLLRPGGRLVNLVSSAEIYVNEWTSFSTKDFPENRAAKSGEKVFIVMLDVKDRRPVEDILCTDDDYHEAYKRAGLSALKTYWPLGKSHEAMAWVSETTTAPWAVYVLERAEDQPKHLTQTELQVGLHAILQSPKHEGNLELIVRRPQIEAREVLEVGELDCSEGLIGDNWKTRGSSRSAEGGPHPDMQLNLMNARAIALLAQEKERWALAGDQLYIDLDLSEANMPAGTRLALGAAIIEITAQPHTGCKKFASRFGVEAVKFVNSPLGRELRLRGVNAKVVQAGIIRVGDTVKKL